MTRILLAVLAAVAVAAMTSCSKKQEEEEPKPAEVVTAITPVDGQGLLSIIASCRGRRVVLNFWATWCPPCVEEMPALARYYDEYVPARAAFISVSVDHPDTIEERVRPFVREHALPFPVHVLRDRSAQTIGRALGLEWHGEVPATIILDAQGRVIRHRFEIIDYDWLVGGKL